MKPFSNIRLVLKEWFPDKTSILYFVFALIAAFIYWGITVTEEKENKTFLVAPKYVNVPPGCAIVGPDARAKINVEVAALSDILKKFGEEDIELTIDAEGFAAGPLVYEVTENDFKLPSSISFVRVFPKVLQLQLDKRITAKIPLKPQFVGKTDSGKQVVSWKIEPPSVEAEGPESIIEATRYLPTQPIPLNNGKEDFSVAVIPISDDPEVTVKTDVQPVLKVVLGEKKVQRAIKNVPVFISRLLPNTEGQPVPEEITVVVEGSPGAVGKLAPSDLFAQIDVGGLGMSDTPYRLKPAIEVRNSSATGCSVVSSSPPFVEVVLKERRIK